MTPTGDTRSRLHHIQRMGRSYPQWEVRVTRRHRTIRKCFTDGRHGGKARALAQAIAYRDQLLAAMPAASHAKIRYKRNTSGTVGVHLVIDHTKSGVRRRWSAVWFEDGRPHKRTFSVEKLGYHAAKALAVATRKAKTSTLAKWRRRMPATNNAWSNTGVVGVRRRVAHRDKQTLVLHYVAYWHSKGRQHARSFSARKYGEEKAFALAKGARRRGVAKTGTLTRAR
jgi:hypothetical protein